MELPLSHPLSLQSDPNLAPVSETPDTGGTFSTAGSLALGQTFQGTVALGSDPVDMFRITASDEGVLDIHLTGLSANVSVYVYSANQRLVGSAFGGFTTGSLLTSLQVTPGAHYYIAIMSTSVTSTGYRLNADYSPNSGTPDADTLAGTGHGDLMAGYAGDDSLSGRAGDDRIYGGDGNDSLHGGTGNDSLWGDAGQDALYGGAGRDILYAGDGGDQLFGGDDPDFLYGGIHADRLDGGTGNDWLSGNYGDDLLLGRDGNDSLYGSFGNDSLHGNDGNDYLEGWDGNDLLTGDAGDDVLTGGRDADTLYGGTGRDQIRGDSGSDLLYGGTEDDRLYGGLGRDTVYGGDGNDELYGGDYYYYGYGSDGVNFLYGGRGADTLTGGVSRDFLDLGANDGAEDVVVILADPGSRTDARRDVVIGFEHGTDYFDFYAVDADPGRQGNQRLAWGDSTPTAHGLWVTTSGPNSVVSIDTTGDAVADATWLVRGVTTLGLIDFLL